MCEDLISIIVPVYNVEEFLNQGIKSVLGQSYKKLRNYIGRRWVNRSVRKNM